MIATGHRTGIGQVTVRLSLRAVLILGTIGLQLVTVGAILFSTVVTTQDALLSHAHRLMKELSRETIGRTEQFLDPARRTAHLTLRLAGYDVIRTRNPAALERYFYEQLLLYPWFAGLYFGGADGSFVFVKREGAESGDAGFLTKIVSVEKTERRVEFIRRNADYTMVGRTFDPTDPFDPRTRPWFLQSRDGQKISWTAPYIFFTSQRAGVSATGPVNDFSGNFIGAVGVDIEIFIVIGAREVRVDAEDVVIGEDVVVPE